MPISQQRAYIIFGVVVIALLMASIDSNIVIIGLPTVTRELHTSLSWSQWVLTGYQLSTTVMLPIVGKLSDSFGIMEFLMIPVVFFIPDAARQRYKAKKAQKKEQIAAAKEQT